MTEVDDYASYLSAAAKSEIAVVHEFRVQYYRDESSLHVFFEGEDDPLFYLTCIRRRTAADVNSYYCGGKPKLKEIRNNVYEIVGARERLGFFVDRDYDDLIGTQIAMDDNTYLSDNYSIENNLVCVSALRILLTDFAGMSKIDPYFDIVISSYCKSKSSFEHAMRPLVAWILTMKATKSRPNLSNVDLNKIISFDLNGKVIRRQDAFKNFKKVCGLSEANYKYSDLLHWYRAVGSLSPDVWTRGKYALWFFRRFLLELFGQSASSRKRWKVPKPLQNNTLFEALGSRIDEPPSLVAFLTSSPLLSSVIPAASP